MSKLNGKSKEVLDACLVAESPEVKAKVYEIIEVSELDPSDPMFLVLALTGQMRVLLEAAPAELSQLLANWKEQAASSLQQIHQAITRGQVEQQQQVDTLQSALRQVTEGYVAGMRKVGMATTSAIAQANQEVLTKSQQALTEVDALKNQLSELKAVVDQDRQSHLTVIKALLEQAEKAQTELSEQSQATKTERDALIQQLKGCYAALKKIQSGTKWLKWGEWLSPMTALIVVFVIGIGSGWWYWWQKYNESDEVLGRRLVKWNLERIIKCEDDHNPKCTLWILPPPEKR